jgi:hypothetical protein
VRPHRRYVDDVRSLEAADAGTGQAEDVGRSLAWPLMTRFAANRLARAWETVKMQRRRGQASDVALIEMHRAALRLMAVTRAEDLWTAIDVLSDCQSTALNSVSQAQRQPASR